MEIEVIHGPTVPMVPGVLYQVTLASGLIVTNPEGFATGSHDQASPTRDVHVSERGHLLRPHVATESAPPA